MKSASQSLRRACLAAAATVAVILTGCGGGGGGGGGGGDAPVGDTTPPAVVSVTPAADATSVALNSAVTVSFSEAVDCTTVNASSLTLSAGGSPVDGAVACSGSSATFTPSANLAPDAAHAATVTTAVRDAAGNALGAAKTWSFTTGAAPDTTPPTVVSVSPAPDATDVALNAAVAVSFDAPVDCATVTASSFTLAAGSSAVSGSVACSGNGATFTPSARLAPSTSHAATLTTAVKDAAGNALVAARTWSFTTGAAPDTTPPTIVSVSPAAGATNVALNAAVTVSFSEPVDCATVTASSFTLTAGSSRVNGAVACSGNSATLTPSASLAPSTLHTATVTTAAKDAAGNALAAARTWSFTTSAAPDTTPPTVVSATPAADATNVPLNTAVTVAFGEPVDCATVNGSSFTVAAASGPVNGSIACGGNAATFTPSARLAPSTTHTATVTTAVKDAAGNALAAPASWRFTTGAAPDTTPPAVVSTSPAASATGVPVGAAVIVTFSERVDCATVTTSSFTLVAGTRRVDGSVACSGNGATFTPSVDLPPRTVHTAIVTTAVKDAAGNAMASTWGWTFTTGAAPDTTPPTVVSVTPAAAATGVALDAVVTVSFSEPVDCATVTASSLTLAAGTTRLSGAIACSGGIATFTPSARLAPSTSHTATVTTSVKDVAGNALAAATTWSFTTGAAPDTTPPTVVSTTPTSGATNVALDGTVTVTFSEPVDCATVTASSFTLVADTTRVGGSVACSGSAATFTPSASLPPRTLHTAVVTTAVKDLAGNALAATWGWSFTTAAPPDTTPPTIVAFTPASGATDVALDTTVTVTFSEPVDCATATSSSFTLVAGGSAVRGWYGCSGSSVTFTPLARLAGSTSHTVTVTAAVKDWAGNALSGPGSWSFTTTAAPDTTPPAVSSVSPANTLTEVATTTAVQITFSEPVDCATLTAASFTLETAAHAPVAGTVTCSNTQATLRPSAPLARATEHVATVTTAVKDVAGNSLGAAYAWRFTTQAGSWGAATQLDGGAEDVNAFQLAVNAAGAAVAVWIQTDAANQKHLWWAGFDPATGWSAPEAAESLAGDASQPQVVIDAAGDSVVAWTHTDSSGAAVWTRVRAADGTWGGPLKLWGDSPSLGVDGNGNVICTWRHNDGARFNVWASRYPLGTAILSGAWEAAVLIEADDNRTAVSMPSVAVNKSGDAVAVWTFYAASLNQYVVVANHYSVASGRWGSPVDLSQGSTVGQQNPTAVMNDAGEAVAIWRQAYLNGALGYVTVISTARYTSTGWSVATQFDWINGLLAAAPSVAGNGRGDVEVVWGVGTCDQVEHRRYVAGTGWAQQSWLSASSCADRPAAALDPNGNAMAAWAERTSGTDSLLEAARYSAATASWDATAATVGQSSAMLPAVAADANGGFMALWLRWDGTRHGLLAARFQ